MAQVLAFITELLNLAPQEEKVKLFNLSRALAYQDENGIRKGQAIRAKANAAPNQHVG